jgi:lipoprotein-anchoring transpeptidase ErfK/SrfK|tara:strand:+ start:1506 stop:1985 length:480 start_codon:yes stop_codon:yes gene_type:complete
MHIKISISKQQLILFDEEDSIKQYSISTAKNGSGERKNSECTPRGEHIIAEKIGEGAKENSVFVGRIETNELYNSKLRDFHPRRDWILTRILWLSGIEEGKNKKGDVDSHDRYIYIHGSPEDIEMGYPGSRGCIRMRNSDVIELFNLVNVGTRVTISES